MPEVTRAQTIDSGRAGSRLSLTTDMVPSSAPQAQATDDSGAGGETDALSLLSLPVKSADSALQVPITPSNATGSDDAGPNVITVHTAAIPLGDEFALTHPDLGTNYYGFAFQGETTGLLEYLKTIPQAQSLRITATKEDRGCREGKLPLDGSKHIYSRFLQLLEIKGTDYPNEFLCTLLTHVRAPKLRVLRITLTKHWNTKAMERLLSGLVNPLTHVMLDLGDLCGVMKGETQIHTKPLAKIPLDFAIWRMLQHPRLQNFLKQIRFLGSDETVTHVLERLWLEHRRPSRIPYGTTWPRSLQKIIVSGATICHLKMNRALRIPSMTGLGLGPVLVDSATC